MRRGNGMILGGGDARVYPGRKRCEGVNEREHVRRMLEQDNNCPRPLERPEFSLF